MIRLLILLNLLLAFQSTGAAQRIHISSGFTPPVSDYLQAVLMEMDRRLPDIEISFETLPAERSIQLVANGTNAGECCRIPAVILSRHPDLKVVPVSFFSARFNVFSKYPAPPIERFEDLKPFSVGTVKGWKVAVDNLHRIDPQELYIVTQPEQMFLMLEQDRIDYGVMGYMSGLKAVKDLGLNDIYALQPPLVEKQMFILLHPQYAELVPLFTQTLQQMMDDGSIKKIRETIFGNTDSD